MSEFRYYCMQWDYLEGHLTFTFRPEPVFDKIFEYNYRSSGFNIFGKEFFVCGPRALRLQLSLFDVISTVHKNIMLSVSTMRIEKLSISFTKFGFRLFKVLKILSVRVRSLLISIGEFPTYNHYDNCFWLVWETCIKFCLSYFGMI